MTKVPRASCLVRICEDKRIPSTDGLLELKPARSLGPVLTMSGAYHEHGQICLPHKRNLHSHVLGL